MTRRQPDNKKPTKSDENDTIRSHNKEVKLVSKNQINKKVRPVERCLPHASQTAKLPVNKESHAPVVIDSKKADDKPKKTVKRKSEDGQPEDSAIKNPKQKRIKRRKKFKIGCEHVDFVTELGYKQYIQLAISNVFRYLSDKDVAAAFCVSKKWNYVLDQNAGLRKRRRQYVERQIELRTNLGLENWPIMRKNVNNTENSAVNRAVNRPANSVTNNGPASAKRRVLGEMTNRQTVINR